MLTLDGSEGEGGGQILRSALALSMVTGTPFRMTNIRAARKKPGLMRQHLTAVQAAEAICGATVTGAAVESSEITFHPGTICPGKYNFSVGTAGSTTLVLQSVLPALALASGPSTVTIEGGTHNPLSPPYEFLAYAFLPVLNRMGPNVAAYLLQPGFYPAGGGRVDVVIEPASRLQPLELLERGKILERSATATVAALPETIALREVETLSSRLGWEPACFKTEEARQALGPGNVVTIEIESEHVTEVFTAFGLKGVPAEEVAGRVAGEALEYLGSGVPVGRHLADQLIPLMSLAGGGSFRTLGPSSHALSQMAIVRQFLGLSVLAEESDPGVWTIGIA